MHRSIKRLGVPAVATVLGAASLGGVASAATSHTTHTPRVKPVTYTIAYEGPLSGGNQQLGLNMAYAVELAIKQANAGTTFGRLPFKLAYQAADDQGSPTQSPTTAQRLIDNKSVIAVVGPALSSATKAAEPLFHRAHLATVSPSATLPVLAKSGWNNFFRVVSDDNAQGPADAEFAVKKLHAMSIYTVDNASAYAVGLVSAFDSKAKQLGAKVTHLEAPGTGECQAGRGHAQQYGALATKIVSSKATAMFYGGFYCDFALLAKSLRAAGYKGVLMSDDGSLDPRYVAHAGASVANGTYLSCACTNIGNSPRDEAFASAFKKLAGFPIGTYSAEAYDATNTVIEALKKLGTHASRAAVIAELHHVTYPGLTKTVHFQPDGNLAGSTVYEYEVKKGTIVELGMVSQLVK